MVVAGNTAASDRCDCSYHPMQRGINLRAEQARVAMYCPVKPVKVFGNVAGLFSQSPAGQDPRQYTRAGWPGFMGQLIELFFCSHRAGVKPALHGLRGFSH